MTMLRKHMGFKISTALILGFLPLTVVTKPAAAADIVFNGSFENPAINPGSYGIFTSIPGWTLLPGSKGSGIELQNNIAGTPFDGSQFVELDSDGVIGIYQDLNTEVGQTYKLEYAFSPRPGVGENTLNAKWGSAVISSLSLNGNGLGDTQWRSFTYELVATSPITRLSFDNLNETSDSFGTYLDKVSVAPVPEPLTIGGSVVAIGFGWLLKRKKAASEKA